MGFEWAKPVATQLLFISMSRPFTANPAANTVFIKGFGHRPFELNKLLLGER